MAITTTCPICKSEATALDKTGDADGFDCQSDGKFKVSGTVLATPSLMEASQQEWAAALRRAQSRQPNEWAPCVLATDFSFSDEPGILSGKPD
jgi:hypothetical protein